MMVTFREALDTAINKTGRTPADIARHAGITYDKLRNLRQGKSRTTNVDDAMRVAAAFGVSLEDFYNGNLGGDDPKIAVAGRVGAGASVDLVDAYAKGEGLFHVTCPPQIQPTGVVAVEVVGDSMEPVYSEGDILFYTRSIQSGILAEDIGKKCVVADIDGRVWVKQVQRGSEEGRFHLISLNISAQNVWNAPIQWAARVRFHMPAEFVKKF